MKTALTVLIAGLVGVCVTGAVMELGGASARRELRTANDKLEAELRAAQAQVDALQAEREETATRQARLQELAEDLRARLTRMESAEAGAAEETLPAVKPYPVQAYLGQKRLGQAWVIPRNLHKDTNTQRYVYEPVVWLDESLRKDFVMHHTNVVERVTETRTFVNQTYYPQPVWYAYYPMRYYPATNQWPRAAQWPAANPGRGTVIQQPVATPPARPRTRPSGPWAPAS